jgi:GT2 family glycosyltransferase
MKISIIITTYNRADDLWQCLDSIACQRKKPEEVIVVDNGTGPETEMLARELEPRFEELQISLRYLRNGKGNSLTVARNQGVRESKGDIVLFLDDDVVLDGDYICQIDKVYQENPDAVGVQGYFKIGKISLSGNLLRRFFFLFHYEKDACRVLRSVTATYPYKLGKIISCEWLSGANHSWKKGIVNIEYDENLKKYSEGEDLDFSYRLFKQYPGRLFITPFAKLIHKASPGGRMMSQDLAFMTEVYGLYLFFKLFGSGRHGLALFVWSRIGKVFVSILQAAYGFSFDKLREAGLFLQASFYSLYHIKEIKQGDLSFFNGKLK